MSEILSLTLSSIQADMARMERVSANIANAQTPGYKREGVAVRSFQAALQAESFARVGGVAEPTSRALVPFTDDRPGALKQTGQPLDMALSGPGWFELNGPDGPIYTRNGSFRLDAMGRLVSEQGYPVASVGGGEIQLTFGTPTVNRKGQVFDSSIPGATSPDAAARTPAGQLKIVKLIPSGNGSVAHAGLQVDGLLDEIEVDVRQGYLESSNVSSMHEMVQLMETMRHLESMQKVALGYDEMLGTAIRRLGDIS